MKLNSQRAGKAFWFRLQTFLEWVSGLTLEADCCSQAVHGVTKCLLVLGASTWVPCHGDTSPFHGCSFSPFLVTENLGRCHICPVSVFLHPTSPPTSGRGCLAPGTITQDENHAGKSRVSQVIPVNVCDPQAPGCSPLPPCRHQPFPGGSVPVSHDHPGLSVTGTCPCCSTAP